jgi:hypothetical protein
MNGYDVFLFDFLPGLSLGLSEYHFGNSLYDYDLLLEGDVYMLYVYDVALDHYGMFYRNMLSYEVYDVSDLLK